MRSIFLIPLFFGVNTLATLLNRQYPHLVIPVDKRTGDFVPGTKTSGDVEHAINTFISFDVPSSVPATYCKLNFYVNTDPRLNAPRQLWGVAPYRFNISAIEPKLDKDSTSWNNRPKQLQQVAQVELSQSGVVGVYGGDVPCLKGQVAQYVLYPDNPARDFGYTWYELDYPHGIVYEMFN